MAITRLCNEIQACWTRTHTHTPTHTHTHTHTHAHTHLHAHMHARTHTQLFQFGIIIFPSVYICIVFLYLFQFYLSGFPVVSISVLSFSFSCSIICFVCFVIFAFLIWKQSICQRDFCFYYFVFTVFTNSKPIKINDHNVDITRKRIWFHELFLPQKKQSCA